MAKRDSLDFRADLMSGDIVAGHIRARHVEPVCPELLPLCFQRGAGMWPTGWRTVPLTRTVPIPGC